jgi:hypothetical protein
MFLGTSWLMICMLIARPLRRAVVQPVIAEIKEIANVLPEPTPDLVPVPVSVEAEVPTAPSANPLI